MNQSLAGINTGKKRLTIACVLLCAAAWIAAVAGCGSSVYGEKFQHRLEELQISSEFSVLRDADRRFADQLSLSANFYEGVQPHLRRP